MVRASTLFTFLELAEVIVSWPITRMKTPFQAIAIHVYLVITMVNKLEGLDTSRRYDMIQGAIRSTGKLMSHHEWTTSNFGYYR
jgi:hypothetical protein